ncbi:MAG: type III pantothenate kinase, partial [Cellvibrionaceae bacterium]|nr:type III pantothenate kinase [Cellvibrionaceae bacterium]
MRLLIDQGNTRIKWRLLDDTGQACVTGASATLDWMPLKQSIAVGSTITTIFVASVLGPPAQRKLAAFLLKYFKCKPEFAR